MENYTMKVEVSNGEIVDKLTILRIKEKRIGDAGKLSNIKNEIEYLVPCLKEMGIEETSNDVVNLLKINIELWDVEDDIREQERIGNFGDKFIELARSVYVLNDQRAKYKKTINKITGSTLVEEKSYKEYTNG
ncbi:MAG: hypothetical protein H8D80_01200 [Proteobacteria bacterium]|nr:hypothetical protein [Pseudomonadota bacterium]